MRRRPGTSRPCGSHAAAALLLLAALACSRKGATAAPETDANRAAASDVSTTTRDAGPATSTTAAPPTPGTDASGTVGPEAATEAGTGVDGGTGEEDADLDTAGLPPAEADLRRMMRLPCPPAPATPEPLPEVFASELECRGPLTQGEGEYEPCERALEELTDRLASQRREVRALLRDRKFLEARRALRSWLDRHPCPEGCDVPPPVERLARDIEVAFAADGAVAELGGAWFERPVRVYAREDLRPHTRPDLDARLALGYAIHEGRALDAWAVVPGGWIAFGDVVIVGVGPGPAESVPCGWVLVADPMESPGFRVREPPTAALGWVLGCRLVPSPPGSLVTDVGHPVAILRPPAAGAPFEDPDDGRPCTRGGKPGREYAMWADERSECFPYVELCGGPGLVPPTWELKGPDEDGCGDCCTNGRSLVEVGDWCRARKPGWVWNCSADGTQLVCGPPGP
ncbi:MAG: hypothetical protein JXB32_26110 [Deltaproteobacteria bacterium]|nr:hypothetical protein [Deltaproteobacteria bacterium]